MKIYTEQEIKEVFGTYGFWVRKTLSGKLNYLNGIPEFDRLDPLQLGEQGSVSNLECKPKGLVIEVIKGVWYFRVGLHTEKVLYFVIEPQAPALPQKAIIGCAIVNGISFGNAGTPTGAEAQPLNVTSGLDYTVTMGYLEDGLVKHVFFTLPGEHLKEVTNFIDTHLPGRLKRAHEIAVQH